MHLNKQLKEKTKESMASVLPITAIVFLLSITIAPLDPGTLVLFLFGAILLIGGMGLFTLGVDMSMTPMGEGVGLELSRCRRLVIPVLVYFVLGVLTTVAEPDLQVLAEQVPSIENLVLILTVAVGVGIFLVIAFLRVRMGIPLRRLLVFFYIIVFILAFFTPANFVPVSFDSGGVTTGPHHSALHHGPGRRHRLLPQRQKFSQRQLRPGGPVLHRPYPVCAVAGHPVPA